MRKLLTAGIFGTILSLTGANYACASIISRGFFDEAMENYATNTALDLKANQTDLTALSNKIGIHRWNTGNVNLEYNAFPFTPELFPEFRRSSESWAGEGSDELPITYYMEANNANIYVPGLAGVTNKLLNGWTNSDNLTRAGIIALNNGWTDSDGETYQGIKALNDGWTKETGGLANPGIKGMFDGWTDKGGTYFPGLYSYSKGETLLQSAYNSSNSDLDSARLLINGANATTIDGVDYTGPVYPLWKLSEGIDKIGTLPEGITVQTMYEGWTDKSGFITNPGIKGMYDGWTDGDYTFPGLFSLSSDDLKFKSIFGTSVGSLLSNGIDKFTSQEYTGPIYPLWKLSQGIDQIGTLPTETAMSSCSVWRAIDLTQNEMPETIGGILDQLYSAGHRDGSCTHDGYNGPSLPNIIRKLIYGYNYNGGTEMLGINGLNVGFTDSTGNVIEPGLRQITNGWTDAKGGNLINPGLKGMYDGWTFYDLTFPGLYNLSTDAMRFTETFGATVSSLLSNGIDKFTSPVYTGPIYPLWKLSQGIDQIGTLPSGNFPPFLGHEFLFSTFDQPLTYPTSLAELISAIYGDNKKPGRTGLLDAIIAGFPFDSDRDGSFDTYLGLISNYNFTKTVMDLANANDAKIGTLPEGITLQGLYELWNREVIDFVSNLKLLWDSPILQAANPEKFSNDIHGAFYAIFNIFDLIMNGLSNGWLEKSTNTYYGGIIDLNEGWLDKSTNTTYQGIKALNEGWLDKPSNKTYPGIKALYDGWRDSNGTPQLGVKELNYVIGTLPTQISGNDTTWARYGFETPIELPTTVGGMFDMLFHDERNSTRFSLRTIMARILNGSYKDDGSAVFYGLYDLTDALELGNNRANYPLVTAVKANTAAIEKIGTVPDGKNLAGMISETDAKIGTVPAGYDNVGAALTAMKSDIDAKNLPSTSDDGQYVLTAKKVGETITYTWVKMDLTTEEQGQ